MHEWIDTPISPEKSPNRKSQNKKSFHGGFFFFLISTDSLAAFISYFYEDFM